MLASGTEGGDGSGWWHEWGQETHFNNLLARIIDGVFPTGHGSRDSIPEWGQET